MSRVAVGVIVVTLIGGVVLGVAAVPAATQDITHVIVTNWPDHWRVEGRVAIDGPVLLSQPVSFGEVVVPPVGRTETTRMLSAGKLTARGFAHVVLSLQGQVKGSVQREGEVGAILVPVESGIQDAFNEQGLTLFALEVVASGITPRTTYFASAQPRHQVGFSTYDVLLYNTTDKAVTANLFAYLTN
jgi:hypothetical protein